MTPVLAPRPQSPARAMHFTPDLQSPRSVDEHVICFRLRDLREGTGDATGMSAMLFATDMDMIYWLRKVNTEIWFNPFITH